MYKKTEELIQEHGLHEAYTVVQNRIIYEQNRWPQNIDHNQIAEDRIILDKLAHKIAHETLENEGWRFGKPSEGEPAEWMHDPFGVLEEKKQDVNLTRIFELIDDDALITVKWDGFSDFEYQGRKDGYFYQDDDIIVMSISENKEEGLIIVVDVEE